MDFSLLFFSTGSGPAADQYQALIEYARFADRHGFAAVWVPERHFTHVGSLFPNPATVHAALARETERVALRAGSVVLALHDAKRVAEEWAVVDSLSRGRAGVSFAVGWHPADFAFFPERYATRYADFPHAVRAVQRLWRGQLVSAVNGMQRAVSISTYPRPVQPELPTWVTASGDPRTFRQAGLLGAHLLTHLFTQTPAELADKLEIYRGALKEIGEDPLAKTVTVMLHTHVHAEADVCPAHLREAFRMYLRSAGQELLPALNDQRVGDAAPATSEADVDAGVDLALRRLVDGGRVLFGDVAHCAAHVRTLHALGVREIACQVDFGLPHRQVMEGLVRLDAVRAACRADGTLSDARSEPRPVEMTRTAPVDDLTQARQRCQERLTDAALRDLVATRPPAGLRIESLARSRGEFVAEVTTIEVTGDAGALARALCDVALLAPAVLGRIPAGVGAEISAIGESRLERRVTAPRWIHCECHPAAGGFPISASATAYDGSGGVLATLTDVEVAAEVGARSASRIETFTTAWSPLADAPRSRRRETPTAACLWSSAPPAGLDRDVVRYRETKPLLDQLASAIIVDALTATGVRFEPGAPVDADYIVSAAGIAVHRRRLLRRLLDVLVADGTLEACSDMLRVVREPRHASFDEAMSVLPIEHSACGPELELLRICGPRLADALRGQVSGVDVLFSGEGVAAVRRFYREAGLAPRLNQALSDAVLREVETLGGPVRILEIGAGTGATTSSVIADLGERDFSYCVSDVSAFFVSELESLFGHDRRLTCKPLDIERNPERQGFAPRGFDVIIASNVLHATADIATSLQHVHHLLAPGGLLLLLEVISPEPVLDIVFGLLPGWWRSEDGDRRSYPLLSRDGWRSALEGGGYGAIEMWPPGEAPRHVPASVIAARATFPARQQSTASRYVILCDDAAIGEAIQTRLHDRGDEATLLPVSQALSLFDEWVAQSAPGGVIYVAEAATPVERAILEVPTRLATMITRLLNGGLVPRVWIATRGAQNVDGRAAVDQMLTCGSLAGLVRAVSASVGNGAIRLVDLDPSATSRDNAERLVDQLHARDPAVTALRDGIVYTQQLVSDPLPDLGDRQPLVSSESTYLVTGGVGGVGARMAVWIAQQGASHVVLLTRPPQAEGRERHAARVAAVRARVERSGAVAHIVEVDAADERLVRLALEQLRTDGLPPIRGVIHAAGTWVEPSFREWSADAFAAALEAKAVGAYVLHNVLDDRPLDFFVLFSSLAALFPSPNQAAYATANAFLDMLAAWRQKRGLSALSIGWGPWADIGYGASPTGQAAHALLAENGIEALTPAEGTRLVADAVRSGRSYAAIARVNGEKLSRHTAPWLRGIGSESAPTTTPPYLWDRRAVTPDSGEDGICELLAGELARLTTDPNGELPRDVPLLHLGLDSLSVLQFTSQLQSRFGVRLSLEDADLSITLRQLAARVSRATTAAGAPPADGPAAVIEEGLRR